ncbi:MAG: DegT/DnrJ/EryC1/StrS family aminotransferase [Anaerolineales bacterium]|nr:DegT/DnrJ/EryC1/StrS family aminotransferase [Anaerolineales bacterium]
MPNIPLVNLKAQYKAIGEEIAESINQVLEAQQFILGPQVEDLEIKIAHYSHCQYGIGMSSGTDALLCALMAIGIQPGDEVITTPYTFFATAGAIARLGARPVFADVIEDTLNIDPQQIEPLITRKTKAIIPVHFAGQAADMEAILRIAQRRHLYVIEDACQAIGADYKGKRVGSWGDIGCFSFFPTKNLGGYGDGGMATTNNPHLAERLRLLRNHGHQPKYYHQIVGGNFRLDALQAAILLVKFKYLENWIEARNTHARTYHQLFHKSGLAVDAQQTGKVKLPAERRSGRHVYHLYVIQADQRDELKTYLHQNGIGAEIYYPVPLHLQGCFKHLGYKLGDLPVSERAARRSLALPIYPELNDQMLLEIVETIGEFYRST